MSSHLFAWRRRARPLSALPALAAVTAALVLAGCTSLAPGYERPALPVAAQFRDVPAASTATASATAGSAAVADLAWQQVLVEPRLQQVVAQALDHNRDLRVAVLNVEKARAQYRIQRAELLPTVQATASQTAARTSAAASGTGSSTVGRTLSAGVGFSSWELDLFGRIRSLKDEALQTYLSTQQTQRSTRLSLVAEVAANWLAVGAAQERLALAQQTLDSQATSLRLTQERHKLGVASAVDLRQMQRSVESARVDVASYSTALSQARNALELVVGASVPSDLLPQADVAGQAVALAPLPATLSSTVLLQRPDVLAAEHTLQAANADIGAARAAFFPTISLTSSAGRSSDALSSLFDAGSRTWSFVPSISVPLFNAGALQASLDVARISKESSVASYEKAIQSAFSEVADALAARAHVDEQLQAQQALVAATQDSYDLALARYRSGVDSYLDALDAQRSLYSAQQTLITLRQEEAANRVTLYKVLGGGADAQPVQQAATASAPAAP